MPDDATIEAALIAARAVLGAEVTDWQQVTTGIYGRISPRSYQWEEGDRIEIYRALQVDPRLRRRQRAGKGRR